MRNIFLLATLFVVMIISSCQKDEVNNFGDGTYTFDFSNKVPMTWNRLYLEVERYSPGYKPPVSARNYGYMSFIAYESIVHGSDGKYNSLTDYYTDLSIEKPISGEQYDWEVVLNAAYEKAFEYYFPVAPSEQQFQILEVSHSLNHELSSKVSTAVYNRSVKYGKYVAEKIFAWSEQDEWGHDAYLRNHDDLYSPPGGIGKWKPTYPDYLPALLPHWGKVRTFSPVQSLSTPAPPEFSTDPNSVLYKEAEFTRTLVNEIKDGQHEEDLWIAEFWSDDCPILTFTPAGRWVSIANQAISLERFDMQETVSTYAKLGMALSDAGVKCWGEKYRWNLLRPIDYIRLYMNDSDWNTVMCPDGSGGFYTPNFPTYPSGHATFSAAASVVLDDVFGSYYPITDRSHEHRQEFRGKPRSFTSWKDMALENAYSRVPLGVHFESDSESGSNLGFEVGSKVVKLPWKK